MVKVFFFFSNFRGCANLFASRLRQELSIRDAEQKDCTFKFRNDFIDLRLRDKKGTLGVLTPFSKLERQAVYFLSYLCLGVP